MDEGLLERLLFLPCSTYFAMSYTVIVPAVGDNFPYLLYSYLIKNFRRGKAVEILSGKTGKGRPVASASFKYSGLVSPSSPPAGIGVLSAILYD